MKKGHHSTTINEEENESLLGWDPAILNNASAKFNASTQQQQQQPPRFVVAISKYLKCNRDLIRKTVTFAILVPVYFLSAGFIAITNKAILSGPSEDERGFNCPLTMTFIQLMFVSVALVSWSVFQHFVIDTRQRNGIVSAINDTDNDSTPEPSWVFGPRFLFKVKHLFVLGTVFGLKLGVMNWGLSQLKLGEHFLLQAASLFWTVLFAWWFLKEKPSLFEIFLCLCVIVGETLVSFQVGKDMGIGAVFPLIMNLIPPLLLGVLLILLRKATKTLMRADVGMKSVELTGIKLAMSALTVLPFAFLFEGFLVGAKPGALPFWTLYHQSSHWIPLLLLASIVLTLIFQVTLTSLSYIAGAITVGVASEVKVVAQVLLLAVVPGKFNKAFETTWEHILGTILVLGSALAFSIVKYFKLKKKQEQREEERNLRADG